VQTLRDLIYTFL